jgi:hypothetical protein
VIEGYHEPTAYAGSALWPFAAPALRDAGKSSDRLPGIAIGARLRGVMDALSALPGFDRQRTFCLSPSRRRLWPRWSESAKCRSESDRPTAPGWPSRLFYVHAQPHLRNANACGPLPLQTRSWSFAGLA